MLNTVTLSAFYLPLRLEQDKVNFLVDTGCFVTLISQNTIETVDTSYRVDIESVSITLVTASGNELPVLGGKKKLTFKIGNNVYTHDILIVAICQGKKELRSCYLNFQMFL